MKEEGERQREKGDPTPRVALALFGDDRMRMVGGGSVQLGRRMRASICGFWYWMLCFIVQKYHFIVVSNRLV